MAEKLIKVTATNTSNGPHVLNSIPSHVVQPGETVEGVEMSEAEHEAAKGFGVFKFGAAAAKAAAKDDDKA